MNDETIFRTECGINVIARPKGAAGLPTVMLEIPDYTVVLYADTMADLLKALCEAELAVFVKVT